jgi:hypothetical protein
VKNIVLAGMNIVIQDSAVVRKEDLAHNFFVSADDAGKNVRISLKVFFRTFCPQSSSKVCLYNKNFYVHRMLKPHYTIFDSLTRIQM